MGKAVFEGSEAPTCIRSGHLRREASALLLHGFLPEAGQFRQRCCLARSQGYLKSEPSLRMVDASLPRMTLRSARCWRATNPSPSHCSPY